MPGAGIAVATTAAALLAAATPIVAQPAAPVGVDVTLTIRFDAQGRFAALRERCTFDDAYSATLLKALDADGDGGLDAGEMGGLAGGELAWIARADYLTRITKDSALLAHGPVNDLIGGFARGRFTASFTLTLVAPQVLSMEQIAVADPAGVFNFAFDSPDVLSEAMPSYCRVGRSSGPGAMVQAEVDCR